MKNRRVIAMLLSLSTSTAFAQGSGSAEATERPRVITRDSGEQPILLAPLPFGAGLIAYGHTGAGVGAGVAQGLFLYLWYKTKRDIAAQVETFNEFETDYHRREKEGEVSESEKKMREQYLDSTTSYVADASKKQTTFLYLFVLSWVASSTYAFVVRDDGWRPQPHARLEPWLTPSELGLALTFPR